LNQVHAELRCTKLNSDQLIQFSWTAVVIPWTTLIGQPRLAYGPTTVTSKSHAMLTKQSSTDCPQFVRILRTSKRKMWFIHLFVNLSSTKRT